LARLKRSVNEEVIKKILKPLGLWNLKVKPRPEVKAPCVVLTIPITNTSP
jgi:hypothetical protein